jgi:GH3 auxin-responsive promoter
MTAAATLANALWLASGLRAARRFGAALRDPHQAQDAWLRRQLQRHAASAFGRAHDFAALRGTADFVRRVPLADYTGIVTAITRVAAGERDVLAVGPVTHLAPTSGTSGAQKLIPFSPALQEGFDAAVSAWMHDLVRQRPALAAGPAYWSVSPLDGDAHGSLAAHARAFTGAIPVGFADDADYLGSGVAWLVRRALAAPSALRHVRDVSTFWRLTALALLRQRQLRLISVWHPSFLELLVAAAADSWASLLEAIDTGDCPWIDALPRSERGGWRTAANPARASELRRMGPDDWGRWWPRLQVVSCWGAQAAEPGWRALVARLPGVLVQPKGLLATEAVVTIPIGDAHPLAVTSHFFEFLDDDGTPRLAHEVERGRQYEVVVSNGGGLWRYRLGDVVQCTGHVHATPAFRFLGRAGRVSDLRGEKLGEAFVASAIRAAWPGPELPAYVAIRPWIDGPLAGYDVLLSDEAVPDAEDLRERLLDRVEQALAANPHYALARRVGQLQRLRLIVVSRGEGSRALERAGGRLGDAKPKLLLDLAGAPD